jgi:hypothetical protein
MTMSSSLATADRNTHLKIVVVSLIAGIVVGAVAINTHVVASKTRPDADRPFVAAIQIPDPPAMPCKRQTWPSADRGCLTWTAPPAGSQPAAQAAETVSAPELSKLSLAQVVPSGLQPKLQAAPVSTAHAHKAARKSQLAQRRKSESLRVVRGLGDDLSDLPVSGFAAGRSQHRSILRPTNQQDVYYYASGLPGGPYRTGAGPRVPQ